MMLRGTTRARLLWLGVFALVVGAVGIRIAQNRSEAARTTDASVPSFLPQPADAALVYGTGPDEPLPSVFTWSSSDTVQAVAAQYRDACGRSGWTAEALQDGEGTVEFQASDGNGALQAVAYEADGQTVLTVIVTSLP